MLPIFSVECAATGLFALTKDIKVLRGATCGIRRNPANEKGKLLFNMSI